VYLRNRDKILIVALILLFIIGSIIGWLVIGQAVLLLSLTVVLGLLLTVHIESYRRIQDELQQSYASYRQIDSLFNLFSTLKFRHPLPPMRGEWAIAPDFANIVISLIWERKPRLVLELGSGVSTLVTAYCLQEIGAGTLVSLDHDERFAAISAANVVQHGLQDIATVIYAPLKEVVIGDKTWLWYDVDQLPNLESIDVLIIDGPPGITQKLARYPALPTLLHLLSDDAVVLLDDACRSDEREIVKLWLKELVGFSLEEIDVEKGAAILRRQT
jgi:predicted O-methyltransferase YrrM